MTIDAGPCNPDFTLEAQDDKNNPDAEAVRASTIKLLELAEREQIGLVMFGHDQTQWQALKS